MTEALSRGITARLAFAISCLLCAFICLPSVLLRGRPPRRKRRNQAQVTLEMEQLRRALTEARHVAISRPRPAWQASSTSILKRWWTPSLSRKACVQACSVDTEYLSLSLLLSWGMAVCTPPPPPPPPRVACAPATLANDLVRLRLFISSFSLAASVRLSAGARLSDSLSLSLGLNIRSS